MEEARSGWAASRTRQKSAGSIETSLQAVAAQPHAAIKSETAQFETKQSRPVLESRVWSS